MSYNDDVLYLLRDCVSKSGPDLKCLFKEEFGVDLKNVIIKRLIDDGFVLSERNGKLSKYTITQSGLDKITALERMKAKKEAEAKQRKEEEERKKQQQEKLTYPDIVAAMDVIFSEVLYDDVINAASTDSRIIKIDLAIVEKHNPDIYDFAYKQPEEFLKAITESLRNVDTGTDIPPIPRLYDSGARPQELASVNRVSNNGRLLVFEGTISSIEEVKHFTKVATFECRSCGERRIELAELQDEIRRPYKCNCGSWQWEITESVMADRQYFTIIENNLSPTPEQVTAYVEGDLVNSIFPDKRLMNGNKVRFYAICRFYNKVTYKKIKASAVQVVEIINYELLSDTFDQQDITDEDKQKFHELVESTDNILAYLADRVDPTTFGSAYYPIKQAIVLQMAGGVPVKQGVKNVLGTIHLAIIGDPGMNKSQFIKNCLALHPKALYATGQNSTGVGLIAAVDKNKQTGSFVLKAGPVVRCHNGIFGFDEFDKMIPEDQQKLGMVMSEGFVDINKATISARLECNVSCLFGANPNAKYTTFDHSQPLAGQIDMPKNIQSRMDLLFLLRDIPDEDYDYQLAMHMQTNEKYLSEDDVTFFKKFIAYARTFTPVTPNNLKESASLFYKRTRSLRYKANEPVNIGPRQINTISKLSQASAKLRLSNEVSEKDIEIAVKLLFESLNQLALDPETGKHDITKFYLGETRRDIAHRDKLIAIINEICNQSKNRLASISAIEAVCNKTNVCISPETISYMIKDGLIFEPEKGYLKVV